MSVEGNKYKIRQASVMNCLHRNTTPTFDDADCSVTQCNNCGMFIVIKK